jgi:tetrahydromethanopterin S-methyltransferase subunit G
LKTELFTLLSVATIMAGCTEMELEPTDNANKTEQEVIEYTNTIDSPNTMEFNEKLKIEKRIEEEIKKSIEQEVEQDFVEEEVVEEIGFTIGRSKGHGIVEKNVFGPTDNYAFQLISDKPLGPKLFIYIIKVENGVERILETFEQDIDPSWAEVNYEFKNIGELGELKFRVYSEDNKTLLGEGSFTVK